MRSDGRNFVRTLETNCALYGRCSRGPHRRLHGREVPRRARSAADRTVVRRRHKRPPRRRLSRSRELPHRRRRWLQLRNSAATLADVGRTRHNGRTQSRSGRPRSSLGHRVGHDPSRADSVSTHLVGIPLRAVGHDRGPRVGRSVGNPSTTVRVDLEYRNNAIHQWPSLALACGRVLACPYDVLRYYYLSYSLTVFLWVFVLFESCGIRCGNPKPQRCFGRSLQPRRLPQMRFSIHHVSSSR